MSITTRKICLTPTKNEEWILETFLKCASQWADHIIIADQNSTDRTREIATSFSKVILINNDSPTFNEPERQKLLINAARKIECDRRILIALDADEILAGDFGSVEWKSIPSLKPGTVLKFRWKNVLPGGKQTWDAPETMPFGFVDDGSPHKGQTIHSIRVPFPEMAQSFELTEVQALHLQYIDWERMLSKHRWYQCFEKLNFPEKSPVDVYRMYHHMYCQRRFDLLRQDSLLEYRREGIDPFFYRRPETYYWDHEVEILLREHGKSTFRFCDIWKVGANASQVAKSWSRENVPQTWLDRRVFDYLRLSQRFFPSATTRIFDRVLKFFNYGHGQ